MHIIVSLQWFIVISSLIETSCPCEIVAIVPSILCDGYFWEKKCVFGLIFLRLFCFFQRVFKHEDNSTLLRSYIREWSKFFTQCSYLPQPFNTLESNLQGKAGGGSSKRPQNEQSTVQKVVHSLHSWFLCSITISWIVAVPFVYLSINE